MGMSVSLIDEFYNDAEEIKEQDEEGFEDDFESHFDMLLQARSAVPRESFHRHMVEDHFNDAGRDTIVSRHMVKDHFADAGRDTIVTNRHLK